MLADLRSVTVDGNPITTNALGLFLKAFDKAVADVAALRPAPAAPTRVPTVTGPTPGGGNAPMMVAMAPEDPLQERFARAINQAASGTLLPMSSEELLVVRANHVNVVGN